MDVIMILLTLCDAYYNLQAVLQVMYAYKLLQLAFFLNYCVYKYAFNEYNVLFRATTCVWKIHAVKLKNKINYEQQ